MNIHTKFTLILILLASLLAAWINSPDPVPITRPDTISARADYVQATPTIPPTAPGVQFGPIIGTDYTPEPRFTPLPATIHHRACTLTITAPSITLYQQPDEQSGPLGIAASGEQLAVSQISTGADSRPWANTAGGWLALNDGATPTARLATLQSCEILRGNMPNTTLLGLHLFSTTSNQTVLNFVQSMAQAGHPVSTVKGLNGTESLLNEIKSRSPQTVIVYRSLLNADGFGDCPADVREAPDPAATARRWMDGLDPHWDQVNADYYEYVNECPIGETWSAQFAIEVMKIANEQGRCLLLFSLSGGTPDMNEFGKLLPAYRYATENPCQPGRTHGIALHAYSMEDSRLVSETDVWLSMRHRIINDRLEITYPPGMNLPVYITELGIGGGQTMPGCDIIIRDTLQYIYQLEEDPYVKGFHLWNVGSGGEWYDVSPCLPALAESLIDYYK